MLKIKKKIIKYITMAKKNLIGDYTKKYLDGITAEPSKYQTKYQ